MHLNPAEWKIKYFEKMLTSEGWYVANFTHWGKTLTAPETGEQYFSGWDAYYLHPDNKVEAYSYYWPTEEEAKTALTNYLNTHV